MKDQLGWAGALPVLAGDTLKGTAAGLLGLMLAHGILVQGILGGRAPGGVALVYAAVAAAMIGHAWPVFARLRGGRSVLTFAGGFAVICPPAFALGIALCAAVALLARSFAIGARAGVFAVPFLQLIFTPALEVAATGALMSFIGVRFGMAALAARHRKGLPHPELRPGRPHPGVRPHRETGRRPAPGRTPGRRITAPPPGPHRPNSPARHPDERGHVSQRREVQSRPGRRIATVQRAEQGHPHREQGQVQRGGPPGGQAGQRQRRGEREHRQVGGLVGGAGHVGHRQRPAPFPPHVSHRCVHVHVQQVPAVEEADPPAPPGQLPGQRDVVGEVPADRREAACGRQPGPAGQQALAVDDHAVRPWLAARPDRAEPVDQGGQHGGVQALLGHAVAANRGPALTRSKGPWAAAVTSAAARPGRARVSASRVSTYSPDATSRPCCSAHCLPTQPEGRGRPGMTRAPARAATAAVPSVDSSSTTITSRTPGSARAARTQGAIRPASSRAGTMADTVLPAGSGTPVRNGGRIRRPRASRVATTAAAAA